MQLTVNGESQQLEVQTLAQLLEALGYQAQQGRCVVALNQTIVPWSQTPATKLSDGDQVDVLGAITGG
jgi:sulfur carrier protein